MGYRQGYVFVALGVWLGAVGCIGMITLCCMHGLYSMCCHVVILLVLLMVEEREAE